MDLVVLDDYPARSEAMQLGLEVKGTLGIIRKLMELGRIEYNLRELLENLRRMNFRVRDELFWEVLGNIDQKPG